MSPAESKKYMNLLPFMNKGPYTAYKVGAVEFVRMLLLFKRHETLHHNDSQYFGYV